jgi:hypothetical protein
MKYFNKITKKEAGCLENRREREEFSRKMRKLDNWVPLSCNGQEVCKFDRNP